MPQHPGKTHTPAPKQRAPAKKRPSGKGRYA